MTDNRKFFIPLFNGILEPRHRKKIGPAIWLFLWLIDRSTTEREDGDMWLGLVLGGKPITARYVAEHLGCDERSVRRHLKQLEDGGYIIITGNSGEASSYAVRKSKKFHRARAFLVEPEIDRTKESAVDFVQQAADAVGVDRALVAQALELKEKDPALFEKIKRGEAELPPLPRTKLSAVQQNDSGQDCPAPRTELAAPPDKSVRANKEYKTETKQREKSSVRAQQQSVESRGEVDPRRKDFLGILDQHLKATIPDEEARPKIHPHVTVPLDRFLKDYAKLNAAGFRLWLKHRADSDRVNFTETPRAWMPRLSKYACGPLDQFGKPKPQASSIPQPVLATAIGNFAEEQRRKIEAATADRAKGGVS